MTDPTEPDQDVDLMEVQRQLWAVVAALTKVGFTLEPPSDVSFSVVKPDGWHRHQVICSAGGHEWVIERFWSWDRAEELATCLSEIMRSR